MLIYTFVAQTALLDIALLYADVLAAHLKFQIVNIEIDTQTLTPSGFGVEISGIDISKLRERTGQILIDAFNAHGGLLVLRDQVLKNPDHLCQLAALFGDVERNEKYDPHYLLPDHPEILRVGNTIEHGQYSALFIRADPPPLLWHCDDSFRHPQPIGSCFYCVEAPESGGETGFAGMTAAYDELSETIKSRIDNLVAVHSYDHLNELLRRKNPHRPPLSNTLRQEHPPVRRPLVAQHPVTGKKSLYLPICHIEYIEDMAASDGKILLEELQAHAVQKRFTYFQNWRPGDLVVWDNRCTLHAPTLFDDQLHTRLMYRLTMTGAQIAAV